MDIPIEKRTGKYGVYLDEEVYLSRLYAAAINVGVHMTGTEPVETVLSLVAAENTVVSTRFTEEHGDGEFYLREAEDYVHNHGEDFTTDTNLQLYKRTHLPTVRIADIDMYWSDDRPARPPKEAS